MNMFESDLEMNVQLRLPAHEVLMSFVNDVGAEAFEDWWFAEGKHKFEKWAEEQEYID